MRDGFQLCEQPVQLVIFRHQRIAAENRLVEFRMRSDIAQERCLPVTLVALIFGMGKWRERDSGNLPRSRLDQQKRPVVVSATNQALRCAVLPAGRWNSGRDDKLILRGKYLTQKRIVRIAFLHAIDK